MPGARNTQPRPLKDALFQCDSCDHEVSGYSRSDLVRDEGWKWHEAGTGLPLFVLCGECRDTYARRREAKLQAQSGPAAQQRPGP